LQGELLAQATIDTSVEETYIKLKTELTQRKFKITNEQPPNSLTAVQGSIWGTSAKSAQKTTKYTLQQTRAGTRLTAKSTLTKKYVYFTVVGVLFSLIVLFICAWIAIDVQTYLNTENPSTWSWLAQSGGEIDLDKTLIFTRLSWILTTFLALTLLAEGFILIRLRRSLDAFAGEILKALKA
jgi:hypothetical protein